MLVFNFPVLKGPFTNALKPPGWQSDWDVFYGTWGDDEFYGGSGNDTMWGSIGADLFHGGDGSDTVNYSRSSEAVHVDFHNPGASGYGGLADGDRYYSVENIIGSAFDDRFFLDTADNKVWAGAGDDYMTLTAGADMLDGGSGIDTISGRGDGLTINFATGIGSGGIVSGHTYANIENVILQGNQNTLIGGAEDNRFTLEGEQITAFGGDGDDVFWMSTSGGLLDGGDGNDYLYVGRTAGDGLGITFDLGAGEYYGNAFAGAPVTSFANFEHVAGSYYADTFLDDAGDRTYTGGFGEDVFVFQHSGSNERDVITDFEIGVDVLDLSGTAVLHFNDLNNGGSRRMVQDGADTVIHTANGNEIVLLNVVEADLTAADFLF